MSIWQGLPRRTGMFHLMACLALATALVALLHSRFACGPLASTSRVGHYTLGEKLGEGGMGVVYRAEHAALERPVAIKLLSPRRTTPADIERFEREARLARNLQHASTVAVYDVGYTRDGRPYYAMELVEGLDLQTLVERQGALEPQRVARLLLQLAATLSELHATGLIHRDVKPANVMLCHHAGAAEVIKLLDFGLSMSVASSDAELPPLMGTPLYLPPEAITSPERVDPRSDIYSLGALGYFLLTGHPPFPGESLLEVCGHHLHSKPMAPSQRLGRPLPQRLEALIVSCLAKELEQRPSSAALLAALAQLAPPAVTERAPCSLQTWRSESDALRAARAQSWLVAAGAGAPREATAGSLAA